MRHIRWIIVFVAVVAVTACADGAGDITATRAAGPQPSLVTTTTGADRTQPTVTEDPVSLEATESSAPTADDPIPDSVTRPARTRAGRARPAGPQPTGHLEIPKIGLSHPTYEGIDLATINHGPSHWPGTALPGERGNTVFPGHRTTYTRPFWDIDRLVAGDDVVFTTPMGRFTYRVTDAFVVSWTATWIVEPTEHATFTIFACHPKGSDRQRYVVTGELVSPPATTTTTAPSTTTTEPPEESSPGLVPWLP